MCKLWPDHPDSNGTVSKERTFCRSSFCAGSHVMMTLAPSLEKASATARPMPRELPVTKAHLPCRNLLCRAERHGSLPRDQQCHMRDALKGRNA